MTRTRRPRTQGWAVRRVLKEQTPVPRVTHVLLGINFGAFVVTAVMSMRVFTTNWELLRDVGAAYPPLTTDGQWWRLVTPVFLHADVIHLAVNMLVLWYMGGFAERLFGGAPYTVLYLGSGLIAGMAGLYLTPGTVSVGASGALFGVLGGVIGFGLRRRHDPLERRILRPAAVFASLFIAYQMLLAPTEGVDVAAHATGGIAGLLLGLLMGHPIREESVRRRPRIAMIGAAATVLVTGLGCVLAPRYADMYEVAIAYWKHEERAMATAREVRDAAKDADAATVAGRIQSDVLPAWEAMYDLLPTEPAVPSIFHEIRRRMRAYVDARLAAIHAWAANLAAGRPPFEGAFVDHDRRATTLRNALQPPR